MTSWWACALRKGRPPGITANSCETGWLRLGKRLGAGGGDYKPVEVRRMRLERNGRLLLGWEVGEVMKGKGTTYGFTLSVLLHIAFCYVL